MDADDQVFVDGKQHFAVLRIDGDDRVAAVIAEVDDFADDAAGAGVADLKADQCVFLLFFLFRKCHLASDQLFGFRKRIDVFKLDDRQ